MMHLAARGILFNNSKVAKTGILVGLWDETAYLERVGKDFDPLPPIGRG